jgi:hypothetical protein
MIYGHPVSDKTANQIIGELIKCQKKLEKSLLADLIL